MDYTINFGNFAYDDCAGLHSQGEDIANEVIELIYLCIKSNAACEDPLRLKNEVSSMTWTEYGKNHFDLITLVQQGIISSVQLDLPTFRQKLNRIYCSSIRSTLNIA